MHTEWIPAQRRVLVTPSMVTPSMRGGYSHTYTYQGPGHILILTKNRVCPSFRNLGSAAGLLGAFPPRLARRVLGDFVVGWAKRREERPGWGRVGEGEGTGLG